MTAPTPAQITNPAQANWPVVVNENNDALAALFALSENYATSAGLVWGYYGGDLSNTIAVAAGTFTLDASTTVYVVVHRTTGVASKATTTTNWNNTATYGRCRLFVTGASSITSSVDWRFLTGGIFDHSTAAAGDVVGPASSVNNNIAQFDGTTGKLLEDSGVAVSIDGTFAANSDAKVPTEKATKTYIASVITGGASDVMIFLGVIDCSANPNYPAANAGAVYKVSVAGKIGGGSGPNVEAGDTLYCITDATSSGTHAGVGANWVIAQVNVDGVVTGQSASVDSEVALFSGTSGKIIKRETGTGYPKLASGVQSVQTAAQLAADLQSTGLVADMAGFRNIPANGQSAAYTTVAADSGKSIDHPSTDANARTFTIDSNANVPYPAGTCITFTNMTSQVVTIAITTDTMYLAGTGTTGSRSLAQYGIATARKLTSTTWLISGTGLT
jgi:hypothetical protein